MKILFLGTSYGAPSKDRHQQSILIEENEDLYDYSEWIIEDPAGTIKIEHIMYFTGYIYKHNVSVEIIR